MGRRRQSSDEPLLLLGVNYYPDNQWLLSGNTIPMGHNRYRPMRELLQECYARYRRPLFISEAQRVQPGRRGAITSCMRCWPPRGPGSMLAGSVSILCWTTPVG